MTTQITPRLAWHFLVAKGAKVPALSVNWGVMISYLFIMLLLPILCLINRAAIVPFPEFWRIATAPVAIKTYEVTFVTALFTALINGLFGTLIAWVLVRYSFPLKRWIEASIDLPFALPTAVAGLTLATVYSDQGWIGAWFSPFGIQISFSRLGVAIAMLYISLPFVVRTVQPVLMEIEKEIEEAAWSLGASSQQTFLQVILPPIMPAILTGIALGFSRAVGEYGSVVIISSNTPFKDLIAPVLIFQRLEQYDYGGATVIGFVLMLISLAVLLLINLLQAWSRRYAE